MQYNQFERGGQLDLEGVKTMKTLALAWTCLLWAFGTLSAQAAQTGSIVAWGINNYGQRNVPAPNSGFIAIAAGELHSLGLKEDGSVEAWGHNNYGQRNVPAPNSGFIAIAAGWSHSLGLKDNGSVEAWGRNDFGPCNVPAHNSDFIAIAAGSRHSLGLKNDGSVAAWGWNDGGQCNVPAPNSGFIAIAAGFLHSLGLKEDGSVVAWGINDDGDFWDHGQVRDTPTGNDFVAIASGDWHNLGLKDDGSVAAWGNNVFGQCNVSSPNSGFTAIAAGASHSLGLKDDGSVEAWGRKDFGQCNVPAPNSGFITIATGRLHSLALAAEPANTPPVADAGDDQIVYLCRDGVAEIELDGSGSTDADGDELEYLWTWEIEGTVFDANGVSPIIELPVGLHTIELTVDDGVEVSEPNSCVIEVIEGIEVDLRVMPRVINRKSRMTRILAVVQLPAGFDGEDIDGSFWLYPGEIEPHFSHLMTVNGSQKLFMVFDKSELMAAVPDNGAVVLEIEAQLISGRCLYGSDRIRIIRRGRGPREQTGLRKGTRFRRNRVKKSR